MAFLNLTLGYALFTVLHVFCFALALTVCGLYGHDLTRAMEADAHADSKWVITTPSNVKNNVKDGWGRHDRV